jgi:hypothetical protein
MWRILEKLDGFVGIKPLPHPKPMADGSYNLRLSIPNYNLFLENMRKSAEEHDMAKIDMRSTYGTQF